MIAVAGGVRSNQGTLDTDGYELGVGYRKDHFNVSLFVDDANPELNGVTLTDTSFGLGTAYGRSWNLDMSYYFESIRLQAGWTARYVEDMDDVPVGTPTKDSYFVNNLYLEWQPMADEEFTVNLSVNNIFDEFYYDHATTGWVATLGRSAGLPQPGRDIRLSTTWKF